MSRGLRLTLLGAALVLVAIAWSEYSLLSPNHGWYARAVQEARDRARREAAVLPCRSETFHTLEVDGVEIAYPSCYEANADEDGWVALHDPDASAGTIEILVRRFDAAERSPRDDRFETFRGHIESRVVDGWKLDRFERGWMILGESLTLHSSALVDDRTAILVSTFVEDLFEETPLEAATLETYETVIRELARRNDAAVAPAGD